MTTTVTLFPVRLARLPLATGLLGALVLGSGCAGVNRQVAEGQNFKDCTFALQSIEQATLGGVDVTNVRSAADLSGADRARILAAYAAGTLPLNMRVNLQVTNPNNAVAALNALDYKILVDGNEVGATTQRIEVGPNSTATAAVPVNADVRKAVAIGGLESVGNFALGLADRSRQPTRVTIAVRPSVKFLGATFKKPDYITIDKDVTARQVLDARRARRDSLTAPRP